MKKIIIIEDELNIRKLFVEILSDKYICHDFPTPYDAIKFYVNNKVDLIISDFRIDPEINGAKLIHILKKIRKCPAILITGMIMHGKRDTTNVTWDHFIEKPFRQDEILDVVKHAIL